MIEYTKILKLSDTYATNECDDNVIAMVGSFAPIHRGHFDAIRAANRALVDKKIDVGAVVLTPNSTEYLNKKLSDDDRREWTYERRVRDILDQDPQFECPTYVDDISGRFVGLEQINDYVPNTIQCHLGFSALRLYLIVGSDQLLSMESHLADENNKAICVLRPGNIDHMQGCLKTQWIMSAIRSSRLIITERENMKDDISSSEIRKSSSKH